ELLFERFLSEGRTEPPDIDLDIAHRDRERVIQYVYGKSGRERAAMVSEVITYGPRSAARDLGKALGLTLAQVDSISKSLGPWAAAGSMEAAAGEAGLDPESRDVKLLAELVAAIDGFPRHMSI